MLVFGLVALATQLGLDLLLGGFMAGLITRQALKGQEVHVQLTGTVPDRHGGDGIILHEE